MSKPSPQHEKEPTPLIPDPIPTSHNTPRKQWLRAKGWIPPKSYQPPPTEPPYDARRPRPVTHTAARMPTMRFFLPYTRLSLYITRILEIVLALLYLILVAYSGVHRGWWIYLSRPLGFGITASLLSILISIPTLLGYASTAATTRMRLFLLHFTRIIAEWILIALWAAAFVTMLLPKGKDYKFLFEKPPYAEWDVAVVGAGVEVILFTYSMVLVLQEKYLEDPVPFHAAVELTRER